MSQHEEHDDHGHSVAAWTAVGILIVASAIMALAVLFPNLWLFVGGAVALPRGGDLPDDERTPP